MSKKNTILIEFDGDDADEMREQFLAVVKAAKKEIDEKKLPKEPVPTPTRLIKESSSKPSNR